MRTEEEAISMKKILTDKKGFTLFQLAVILGGLALASTVAIPYFIRKAEIIAAYRTAREVSTVQEASKWYYRNANTWPDSVQTLKNTGYLNPSWPAVNPWGWSYTVTSNPASFTATTTVPNSVGGVLLRALPGVSSSLDGNSRTVSSTVPVPGMERRLRDVKSLAEQALSEARETAISPQGPTVLYGTKINGRAICPAGYAVIQTIRFGGRNNVGYVCQSVVREDSQFGTLQTQIAQLEARNQQLRSQNQLLQDNIQSIQDSLAESGLYQYWLRCVVNGDCGND